MDNSKKISEVINELDKLLDDSIEIIPILERKKNDQDLEKILQENKNEIVLLLKELSGRYTGFKKDLEERQNAEVVTEKVQQIVVSIRRALLDLRIVPLGIIPGISLGLVIQKAQECLVKIEQASSD